MPLKKFEYTDILGWSVTRYDKFQLCRRQYYYDYYGKHDAEFPRARIASLKAMTSVALEIGNVVHDTVKALLERLLKSDQPVDRERFFEFVRKKTDEYCSSKTFAEVYYRQIPAVDAGAIFASAKTALTNFLDSDRFSWVVKKALTNKQGWVIEPPGFGETRVGGYKAYCKVDFLFPVDGRIYILDWKTGKADEKKHRKQLVGYTTWASYQFGKTPKDINPLVAYLLPAYREMQHEISEFDTQEFLSTVEAETREMYAFCSQVERNIPQAKENFSKTTRTIMCSYCNYRELCGINR